MSSKLIWMTTADVAEYLQVSPRTIRNWVTAGRLRARRFGRLIRIHRDDLELFLRP